jgi:hypothetical protein
MSEKLSNWLKENGILPNEKDYKRSCWRVG